MTRIGYFILHNKNKKCILVTDVPYDFKQDSSDEEIAQWPMTPFEVIVSIYQKSLCIFKNLEDIIFGDNCLKYSYNSEILEILEIKRVDSGTENSKLCGRISILDYQSNEYIDGWIILDKTHIYPLVSPINFNLNINTILPNMVNYDDVSVYEEPTTESKEVGSINGEIIVTIQDYANGFVKLNYGSLQPSTPGSQYNIYGEEFKNLGYGWIKLKNSDIKWYVVEIPEKNRNKKSIDTPDKEFNKWYRSYFHSILAKDENFLSYFNTNRIYVIISEENKDVMGLLYFEKKTGPLLILDEHDYRKIVEYLYPNIRKDLIIKDESFGGFEGDDDFLVDQDIVYNPQPADFWVKCKEGIYSVEVREKPGEQFYIIDTISSDGEYKIIATHDEGRWGMLLIGGWIDLNYMEVTEHIITPEPNPIIPIPEPPFEITVKLNNDNLLGLYEEPVVNNKVNYVISDGNYEVVEIENDVFGKVNLEESVSGYILLIDERVTIVSEN